MPRFTAVVPALILSMALAAGAEEPKTITVRGKGSVKAKPDILTLTIGATGKAEKAADATTKLKKKLETLEAELKAVLKEKGVEGATVEDSGVTFCSGSCGAGQTVQIMGRGGMAIAGEEGEQEMTATSEVTVTVTKVDKMASEDLATLVSALLDKGNASDGDQNEQMMTGQMRMFQAQMSSPVQFSFSDPEAALNKAWDEAVKKARARAEAIASRLGLTVGGAVRVRDLSDRDDSSAKQAANLAIFYLAQNGKRAGASSDTELGVQLEVEFELKRADGEKK